jgi:hypothetical protein
MAGKVTLYVRDADLWRRAREVSGPGGLSDLVDRCLRRHQEQITTSDAHTSAVERARDISHAADALVTVYRRSPLGGQQ